MTSRLPSLAYLRRCAAEPPEYNRWNTTSVQYYRYFITAYPDGSEEKQICLTTFRGFLDWYNQQPDEYFPTCGLEKMYSKKNLEDDYKKALSQN